MRRVAIVTAAILLIASASYAPCFYPESFHVEYWQYHVNCIVSGGNTWCFWPGYHTLDGTCDTDCSGNTVCSGDTHIDDSTQFVVTSGDCDPVCGD